MVEFKAELKKNGKSFLKSVIFMGMCVCSQAKVVDGRLVLVAGQIAMDPESLHIVQGGAVQQANAPERMFCKSLFPHKSVNTFFQSVIMMDDLTDL